MGKGSVDASFQRPAWTWQCSSGASPSACSARDRSGAAAPGEGGGVERRGKPAVEEEEKVVRERKF